MGNKILIMILATFAMISTAFADHHEGAGDAEKKPFSIYGDFASSIMFLGNDDSAGGSNASLHDDFAVDLVEINVEKNWSHSKLHLSIGYGNTATAYNSTATNGSLLNVMNAYYGMQSDYGLNFRFGKFESGLAIESFNHMDNTLYTRSYAFNMTPNFFTGLGIDYTINPMFNLGFVLSNGAQPGPNPNPDDNANKSMSVFAGITPMENLAINLRYVTGVEGASGAGDLERTMIIGNAAFMVNEMWDVAVDYTSVNTKTRGSGTATEQDASSIAAYVNGNFGMFGAALRYEMFKDDKAALGTLAGGLVDDVDPTKENTVNAITLGVHTEIDQNARVILEYRTESADEKVWKDKDGKATDSQSMTTLGLMYRF